MAAIELFGFWRGNQIDTNLCKSSVQCDAIVGGTAKMRCYADPFDYRMVDAHCENLMIVHQRFCQSGWRISTYVSGCNGSTSLELEQRRLQFKRIEQCELSYRSHIGLVLRVVEYAQSFPEIF